MTLKKHEKMMADIRRHGLQLLALYPDATERDPVRLCRKLLRIEVQARQYTTDYCNGDIQPDEDYANIRAYDAKFLGMARVILGEGGPALIINHDPRGCALKIDSDDMAGVDLYRDMGGYGLIAPKFDGEE